MAKNTVCTVGGCEKPARNNARICSMHEARKRRGGTFDRRVERQTLDQILSGIRQFGDWTVVGEGLPYQRPNPRGDKHPDGQIRTALCRCACGVERNIPIHTLKQGHSSHCGCKVGEIIAVMKTTHGMAYTTEHRTWAKMKERCTNPNSKDWPLYGGRGISVCNEWARDFQKFFDYMGPKPTPQHSIDRIDVNGNYEPGNVRWASPQEQMQNVRHNLIVEYEGVHMPLIAACREAGLERRYKQIHARMRYKAMSFAEAIEA